MTALPKISARVTPERDFESRVWPIPGNVIQTSMKLSIYGLILKRNVPLKHLMTYKV